MSEEKNIDALQKIVNTVADVVSETVDNLEDGKIGKVELMAYMDNIIPTVNAFMGTKEAFEEIKEGISEEERAELLEGLKQHFDIQNDDLEIQIERILDAALNIVEACYVVASAIKAIRA